MGAEDSTDITGSIGTSTGSIGASAGVESDILTYTLKFIYGTVKFKIY